MLQIIKNTLQNLNGDEKKTLLALVFSNFVISVLDISFFVLLILLVSFYAGPYNNTNQVIYTLYSANTIEIIILFLLLFALKNLAAYYVYQKQFSFVYNVSSRISKQNLFNYLKGSYSNYAEVDSAVYIRKISYQPIEFCHYVLAGLQQISTEIMVTFLAVLAIVVYNPTLFFLLLFALVPPVLFIAYVTKRKLKVARENVKTVSEKSLQLLQEALSGYVESNIYDKNSFFTNRYFHSQRRLNNLLSQIQSIQGAPVRIIETFAVFGLFLLVGANYLWQKSAVLDFINISAFVAAAYKIIPGIVKIINLSAQVKTYQYAVQNTYSNPYIVSEKNASAKAQFLSAVEFKNICFGYKSHAILDNFNLKIEAGNFIGIAGVSGKGKTTIINLLLGFYPPGKGEILFNNLPADVDKRKQFWQNIALVKQKPFVIADSILHNIILDDKDYNKQKLDEALQVTGLDDFIKNYAEGLQKQIAEDGKNISGGQQQRIVLARAFYKDADLLILDEPFSELDAQSEEKILKYLQTLAGKGKMIIFISHNKSSLAYCQKIISLDE